MAASFGSEADIQPLVQTATNVGTSQRTIGAKPPIWRVALREPDAIFEAPADRTILESAEIAGMSLSSSCRVGTCRTCMRRLASGRVLYQMEWPGLLAEEKAEGWILPCVAFPM